MHLLSSTLRLHRTCNLNFDCDQCPLECNTTLLLKANQKASFSEWLEFSVLGKEVVTQGGWGGISRDAYKELGYCKVQSVEKIVDVPVTRQRQVPIVQKVQKTVNVPQVQYNDK
eukprot:6024985-Amphidinium_carterae.1